MVLGQAAECPAATQVHFEISSRVHHAQFPKLVSQTLRPIPARISHLARSRRVPHAPGATANLEQLAREYNETVAFIGRQLKKDPRLKPADVQLSFEHLHTRANRAPTTNKSTPPCTQVPIWTLARPCSFSSTTL